MAKLFEEFIVFTFCDTSPFLKGLDTGDTFCGLMYSLKTCPLKRTAVDFHLLKTAFSVRLILSQLTLMEVIPVFTRHK